MIGLLFIILSILSVAKAEVAVEVVVKPLPAEFQPLEPAIRSHIVAATQAWARWRRPEIGGGFNERNYVELEPSLRHFAVGRRDLE